MGYGDYTKERHQWLDQFTIDDFRNYVKQKKLNNKNKNIIIKQGYEALIDFPEVADTIWFIHYRAIFLKALWQNVLAVVCG